MIRKPPFPKPGCFHHFNGLTRFLDIRFWKRSLDEWRQNDGTEPDLDIQ